MNYFKNVRQPDKKELDLETYKDNQASTLWEGMKGGFWSGMNNSEKVYQYTKLKALEGAQAVGYDVDKKITETLDRMDWVSQVSRDLRDSREQYLSEGNLVGRLGKGAIVGLTQLAFDPTQLAMNIGVTALTGAVGGAVFKGAGAGMKLLGSVGQEVAENVAWNYIEKEKFMQEKYTKDDFKSDIIGSVAMGASMAGIKRVVGGIMSKSFENSDPNIKPTEVANTIEKLATEKEVATGVAINPEDFSDIRTYNGMTAKQLEPHRKNIKAVSEAEAKIKSTEAEIAQIKSETGIDKFEDEIAIRQAKIDSIKKLIEYEDSIQRIGTPIAKDLRLQATRDKLLMDIDDLETEISKMNKKTLEVTTKGKVKKLNKRLLEEKKTRDNLLGTMEGAEDYDIASEGLRLYDNNEYDIDPVAVQNLAMKELDTETKMNNVVMESSEAIEKSSKKIEEFEPKDETLDMKVPDENKIKIEVEKETKPKSKPKSPKEKIESPKKETEVEIEEPKKKYSGKGNRVAVEKLKSAIKETSKTIQSIKGGKVKDTAIRAILQDNILTPYRNMKREVTNSLLGKLQTVENNSYKDFVGTLHYLNKKGVKLDEYLMHPEKVTNLPDDVATVVRTFVNEVEKFNSSIKKFNGEFDSQIAVITSKYSRTAFLKKYSTGTSLKMTKGSQLFGKATFDLRNISEKEFKKIKRNFIESNVHMFKGANRHEQYINAGDFANEFFSDIWHGVRGRAGKDRPWRTSALHNYSVFQGFADEKYITKDSLNKIMDNSTYSDSKMFVTNLVKNLSETKALTNIVGNELHDLVTGNGKVLKSMFDEGFGMFSEASNQYSSQVDAVSAIFRKELGLEQTTNSNWLHASDIALRGIYEGIKPFMALMQVTEVGVSALDHAVNWERNLLAFPKVFVSNFKYLSSGDRTKAFASEYYRNMIGNGIDLVDDIQKQVALMDIGEMSKSIMLARQIGDKALELNDKFSMMKPFEDFFTRVGIGNALTKTKELLTSNYNDLAKYPPIKNGLDRAGISENEFNILKDVLKETEIIDPYTTRQALDLTDVSALKKSYNLSEEEIKYLLSEKVRTLQTIIAQSSESTKGSEFDILSGSGTKIAQLQAKASAFLKRSAWSAMRRAGNLMFMSGKYHGTGNVVWEQQFKAMIALTLSLPVIYYANAVNRATRNILTSEEDTSKILEDAFAFKDDDGYNLTLSEAMKKGIFGVGEGLYLNSMFGAGMAGNVADKIGRGNFKGVVGTLTPRQAKIIKKIAEQQ